MLMETCSVTERERERESLYDVGRNWFLAVEKALIELGCRKVTGDDALFMFHNENGLQGLACLHVDDFNLGRSKVFSEDVIKPLLQKFTFGEVDRHQFQFTGLDIRENNGVITIDQNQYCSSLSEISVRDKQDQRSTAVPGFPFYHSVNQ